MEDNHRQKNPKGGPSVAAVDDAIADLETLSDGDELLRHAEAFADAIAFVHFDPSTAKSNIVEALVHHDDLSRVHRGMYVMLVSNKDGRRYTGRIVDGPFFNPDALKRDSTPVQFLILNQGKGKVLSIPEYHGSVKIEIVGEERGGALVGAVRRPHPASPVLPYDSAMMEGMLHLSGDIRIGLLDNYEDVFVNIDGDDKNVIPRNLLTVGTVGSGKSNTNQVFIEETTGTGYAQVVLDVEGEYIFMDQPSQAPGIAEDLEQFERVPKGVTNITVYVPPGAQSKRSDAREFSVPFESLSPEIIAEITEMNGVQEMRFAFLYEQAIQLLRKQSNTGPLSGRENLDLARGYPGVTLKLLIDMLDEELHYYDWKRDNKTKAPKKRGKGKATEEDDGDDAGAEGTEVQELKIYCHHHQLEPLVRDHQDAQSYGALRKKLRELRMMNIFDLRGIPKLEMKELSQPGHLSVIDLSDAGDQYVINVIIADLLSRMFRFKMDLPEEENARRKVVLTIEEAHGFVSKERKDKMEQTLEQLRRIARRGRKRWLVLHFVTQSPQHLPSELFELANNKIIHQTTGTENLRVLKAAAGTVNEAIWEDVPSLGRGRAVVVTGQYPHPIVVQVRPAASKRNYMV